MSTRHYPPHCTADGFCQNQHHLAYRRLLNAIQEVLDASQLIRDLPTPREAPGPHKKWFFGERQSRQVIEDEVNGLDWILMYVLSSVESLVLPCGWSDARRREVCRDIAVAVAANRADTKKPARATLPSANRGKAVLPAIASPIPAEALR